MHEIVCSTTKLEKKCEKLVWYHAICTHKQVPEEGNSPLEIQYYPPSIKMHKICATAFTWALLGQEVAGDVCCWHGSCCQLKIENWAEKLLTEN